MVNKQTQRCCLGLNQYNDFKGFIKCSNDMDDIYKNIEEYNPSR